MMAGHVTSTANTALPVRLHVPCRRMLLAVRVVGTYQFIRVSC